MKINDIINESEEWDADNVVPCARCGKDIDFNVDDDCTNPNCEPTADEYTRGGGGTSHR